MPEYKEKQIAGRSYQRCKQIVVDNEFGSTPKMSFVEEEIVHVDGQPAYSRSVQGTALVYDPIEVIPLLHPVTGQPLGTTITATDVHVMLYSAYKHAAAKRDAA